MPNPSPPDDYYAILGVARTASNEEIRAAFRTRAKELHPDLNRRRNAKEAFQRVQRAYSVLGHPEQRRQYDLREPAQIVEPPVPAPAAEPAPAPRPRWGFAVAGLALASLALFTFWLLVPTSDTPRGAPAKVTELEKEMEAAMARHAPSFFGLPPEPEEVEMLGKEGKKYLVARTDYKRLLPIYDRLVNQSKELQRQKNDLDARRAALEKEGRQLSAFNTLAVADHRLKVDAFNRDGAALRRQLELHVANVEDYFKQVEAVAISDR